MVIMEILIITEKNKYQEKYPWKNDKTHKLTLFSVVLYLHEDDFCEMTFDTQINTFSFQCFICTKMTCVKWVGLWQLL